MYILLAYVAAGNNSLFALSITPAGLWSHRFAGLFICARAYKECAATLHMLGAASRLEVYSILEHKRIEEIAAVLHAFGASKQTYVCLIVRYEHIGEIAAT